MIRSISIENFRCFKRLRIEECHRINAIVGDNGSGKTALLEAIFLALGTTTDLVQRYRVQRGLATPLTGSARKIEEAVWRDYFYDRDWRRNVSVRLEGDGPEARQVEIAFSPSSAQTRTSTEDPQESSVTAPITVSWIDSDGEKRNVVPNVSPKSVNFPGTDEDLPDFFYFAALQAVSPLETADRFAEMRRRGGQVELNRAIKSEFAWITGLDIDIVAGAPMVCAVMHDGQLRPLPNVSGGLNRIMSVILTIASRERSVVLIDEVENGIYFKHHAAILRLLFGCVRQYNSQIFVTTHSHEWLDALLKAVGDQIDDIALWRVERGEVQPDVLQFDGKTLKAGLEHGAEVRGEKGEADDSTSLDM